MREDGGLVELHAHLYGCIRHDALLQHILVSDRIDWSAYQGSYEAAFGVRPDPEAIVERVRRKEAGAENEFKELFVFGDGDGGRFERFQAKFDLLIAASELSRPRSDPGFEGRLENELDRFMLRILRDYAEIGVRHAELRMMPPPTEPRELAKGLLTRMLERAARGAELGVDARVAISLSREDPWYLWDLMRDLSLGPHGELLTGVDFCAVEEGHPPKRKSAFFDAVREHNRAAPQRALAILYHVGESFEDKSLESALRWVQEAAEMGAHRLGHAIALGVDPESFGVHTRLERAGERADQLRYDLKHAPGLERFGVRVDRERAARELSKVETFATDSMLELSYDRERLEELRKRQDYAMSAILKTGAIIEVCPTSNRRLAGLTDDAHHPVHRFVEAGLPIAVASDDPGIFDTTLPDELEWVRRTLRWSKGEIEALARRSWGYRSEVLVGMESG
ncbi:MAG: hypothetical protein CME06_11550 [Gemmatimonadetes bacterium]|nr:hypothetical protein [Gemmatimonadota bacterium]